MLVLLALIATVITVNLKVSIGWMRLAVAVCYVMAGLALWYPTTWPLDLQDCKLEASHDNP